MHQEADYGLKASAPHAVRVLSFRSLGEIRITQEVADLVRAWGLVSGSRAGDAGERGLTAGERAFAFDAEDGELVHGVELD